jgi:transposase
MSLPGFGPVPATALMAAIDDVGRFPSPRRVSRSRAPIVSIARQSVSCTSSFENTAYVDFPP